MRQGEFVLALNVAFHHGTEERNLATGRRFVAGLLFEDEEDGRIQTRNFNDIARFTCAGKVYEDIEVHPHQLYFREDKTGLVPEVHGETDGTEHP